MKYFLWPFVIFSLLLFGCREPVEKENPYRQEAVPWPSLADSPWPIFQHDAQGTGRSQYTGPQTGEVSLMYHDSFWLNSSPVIGANDMLYLVSGSDTCYLYAINDSGEPVWKCYLDSRSNDIIENVSTPTIGSNNLIYIPSSKSGAEKLHAISIDGIEQWNIPLNLNTSVALDWDGNIYCIEDAQNTMVSLTPAGELRWQLSTIDGFQSQFNPIVFSTDGNKLYATGRDSLYAISTEGNILWSYWTGRWWEYIVIDNDDNLYFYNVGDSCITSLNSNGELNWKVHRESLGFTQIKISVAPTLTVDGNLIFAGSNNVGNIIGAIKLTGEVQWILPVPRTGPHLISDKIGNIYTGSDQFMCISSEGAILWSSEFPEDVPGVDFSPAIGRDNRCYFAVPNSIDLKLIGYK